MTAPVDLDGQELTVLLAHHARRLERHSGTDEAAWLYHKKRYLQFTAMLPDAPREAHDGAWYARQLGHVDSA